MTGSWRWGDYTLGFGIASPAGFLMLTQPEGKRQKTERATWLTITSNALAIAVMVLQKRGILPPLPFPKNAFQQRQRENRFAMSKSLNPLNIVSNRPARILNPAGDVPCSMPQTVLSQTGRSMWCAMLWQPMG